MQGKVKWFNTDKGYGFIEVDGQQDVFVHVSAVNKAQLGTLNEGDTIAFDVEQSRKTGKNAAVNLRKVS